MLEQLFIFFSIFLTLIFLWQRNHYNYWSKHNVRYIKPVPFFGNIKNLIMVKQNMANQMWWLYQKSTEPLEGIFMVNRPALIIRDLQLIKRIMIDDFNSFSNRVLTADAHHDPLGDNNLFFVRNPKWREVRTKLSPVFSSEKIKEMYPLMVEIGENLEKHLAKLPASHGVDIKEVCSRFTTDLIASIAFGMNVNSLEDVSSEFYKTNQCILDKTLQRAIDFGVIFVIPALTSLMRIKVFDEVGSKFLRKTIKRVIEEREQSGLIRNDLIDALIDMKNSLSHKDQDYLKDADFLVAQAAVFEITGVETSASTMSFTLYELARHPEEQKLLRHEIKQAFKQNGHSVGYEDIQKLPLLDQAVKETLRLYPILGYLEREYAPDQAQQCEFSLAPYSNFKLPQGMPCYVSIMGIHRNEKYWSQPLEWIPQRFAPENQHSINWEAYIPFGIGPRNCIGIRLGLLQSKLGLIHLLRDYRIVKCEETAEQVEFDPRTPGLTTKGGIHIKLEYDAE